MLKNTFSRFNVPAYLKLVFVALFCLAALCGCGAPSPSKRPSDINSTPIVYPPTGTDINDTELGKRIRQDYLDLMQKQSPITMSGYSINDIWINVYFGPYNGCVPVIMGGAGSGPTAPAS